MKKSLKKAISIVLCLCLFFGVTTVSFAEKEEKKNIDFVVLLETTGHASSYIEAVKDDLKTEIAKIDTNTVDYRFAIIEYRDFTQYTNPADFDLKSSGFMSDLTEIEEYIDAISLSTFSNDNVCFINAIHNGIMNLQFRENCAKSIIVIGSTKPYNPESVTGKNFASVYSDLGLVSEGDTSECKYPVFSLNLGSDSETQSFFSQLSTMSGGAYTQILPANETFQQDLADAISTTITYIIENVEFIPEKTDVENFAQKLERILNSLPTAIRIIATPIFRLMIVLYNLMH